MEVVYFFFFIVSNILVNNLQAASTDTRLLNNTCITPTNDTGKCIKINSCQPIMTILNDEQQALSNVDFLRQYACGFDASNQPKVCCPDKPILLYPNSNLLPTECGEASPLSRIINGEIASLYEFPWQVALKYSSGKPVPYYCGASLINKRYLLTAAHCINTLKYRLIGARIGEYDFTTEKDCVKQFGILECAPLVQDFNITSKDAIVHPKYQPIPGSAYDIALIRLPQDVEYNVAVNPICLPINEQLTPKELKNLTVTGWGKTENSSASSVLLKVVVPYLENSVCQEIFKTKIQIHGNQLCAGGRDKKDSCTGDSGSPISTSINDNGRVRSVQVGIVSFGIGCGNDPYPGVYTRMTYFIKWVLDNIKP